MALEDFIRVLGIGKVGLPADDFSEPELPQVPGQFGIPEDPGMPEIKNISDNPLPVNEPIKKLNKSEALMNLSGFLSKKESQPSEETLSPLTEQKPTNNYEQQLNDALADRESRMNTTVRDAAITDFIAAGNRALGLKDDRRGTAEIEKKRLEDIKLKNLNEQLGLSGKVLGSEKAKVDLTDMQALNDPNSSVTRALRQGAKEYLGDRVSEETLNKLSGRQLKALNDELGGIFTKIDDRESRERQFKLQMEDRKLAREDLDLRRQEANEIKAKTKLAEDAVKWQKLADANPAYKRFQENQEVYIFADKLANGEIDPNGVSDAALVLQAIKLAQADSSVVRESDQKLFNQVGGMAQSAKDIQQRFAGGKKLTENVRNAYIESIKHFRDKLAEAAKGQTQHLYNKFQKAGVPEDEIPGTLKYLNTMAERKSFQQSKDPKVEDFAKQHMNGDYFKAEAFLRKRGYKGK